MCGIAGFSGNFEQALFMNVVQVLRGPDDFGI